MFKQYYNSSTGFTFILLTFFLVTCSSHNQAPEPSESYWFRGNVHTHSFWSDGRDFPENIAKWYKDNGYNFIVFTEHDILHEGEHWVTLPENHSSIQRYQKHFGEQWVEIRYAEHAQENDLPRFITGDKPYVQVRVRPLEEYRPLFEKPNEFLLMSGLEITDHHAVHLLAFHVDEVIPKTGGDIHERDRMIIDNAALVNEYRIRSGRNVHPVLAHPNWNWAITAEMIKKAENLRFFEIYNGVPEANNEGDKYRPGTDSIWDIVLAFRLGKMGGQLIYGLATDDAHDYDGGIDGRNVGPGKAWIMVRSEILSEESIMDALDKGDFYSSTGVIIKDFNFDGKTLLVEIKPEEGIEYTTKFIGTRSNFDTSNSPRLDKDGNELSNVTRLYSDEIGEVFKEKNDTSSGYTLEGDELYVRVLIISDADHIDPMTGKSLGKQKAWLQPVSGIQFNR